MTSHLLWQPSSDRLQSANLTAFMATMASTHGIRAETYDALWQWSVDDVPAFWDALWDFAGIIGDKGTGPIVDDADKLPGAAWCRGGAVNYAENLLRPRPDDAEAIVFWGEDKVKRRLTFGDLTAEVSRVQQALTAMGIQQGDRICGYMPNMPETAIWMLAATALGVIWSSASPDFGVQGVLDRFGQIEPRLMVTVDGYHYNGKTHDVREKAAAIGARMPSLEKIVVVPYIEADPDVSGIANGETQVAFLSRIQPAPVRFERLPFDHPLFIMFSSGTTGVPKCIVHGHGGTLLQQVKEHLLHCDEKPGDRVFYFTTCGWMMWNWLMAALATRSTLLLYDGSPFYPSGNVLLDYADAEGMTHFGTSAKWIDAIKKAGLVPMTSHDLSTLRAICSTGSPLVPESFDYVYDKVKADIQLASICGGTDILSCFILGSPISPVYRGEIQKRGLGMAVDVFDEAGRPVRGEKGELVCRKAFPSVPIGFWNDPGDTKFREAYFEKYPNTWTQGDYVMLTETGGLVVFGRSDATLNPGGVRIGTAEIYRQVEKLDEVVEALVVGQSWDNDVRVVLFVRLRPGLDLTNDLANRIKTTIRQNATPRHVPAKIVQVHDIPRTKSGKIVELAVRDVLHGRPVKNKEALANPEALEEFAEREELAV